VIATSQKQVIDYVESCHLADGGYFFARVLPSCARDTYFAVKALHILGAEPGSPEKITDFLLYLWQTNPARDLNSIFLIAETLAELGYPVSELDEWESRILKHQNKYGGFSVVQNLDVEVVSELEATYQAVSLLRTLRIAFDEKKVQDFVLSLMNGDGGFGSEGRSTLATTYYATGVLRLLCYHPSGLGKTVAYLRQREVGWYLSFIEDVFWLVVALGNLGEGLNFPSHVIGFVQHCQRLNGGYARANVIGIPTLEYTYYALTLLAMTGALPHPEEKEG
jgi:hypothetical protein